MIDKAHDLPVVRQVQLLELSRSSVYYQPQPIPENDLRLMRRIDEVHLEYPFAGARILRDLVIERPNQVWAMDTIYIPMRRGFVYLSAVIDWATCRVLAWRLSNSPTTDPCVNALEEAIMNTDQGSQFTIAAFIGLLQESGIQVSMDGKGC